MADNKVKIDLELNDGQFTAKVKDANGAVKTFTAGINGLKGAAAGFSMQGAAGTISDLTNRLISARDQLDKTIPASRNYEQALKRVAVISSQLKVAQDSASAAIAKTQKNLGLATTNTDRATYAVIGFSQIISDSAYGIRGMANNFSPFVTSIIALRKESGSTKEAIIGFAKSLAGPTGAIAAVSLISAGLEIWSMHSQKAKTETKELAKETLDLKERVKTLKASYDDLAKAMQNNRKELLKSEIDMLEKAVRQRQSLLANNASAYSENDLKNIQAAIERDQATLKNLYAEIRTGGKEIQKNISLLQGLSAAAKKGSETSVDSFVKNNKLSEAQLSTLIGQLKDYKENVTSIKGGISPNIDEGWLDIAMQLQLTREDLIAILPTLDKYEEKLNKKPEANGLIPRLRKQIEELKKSLESAGSEDLIKKINPLIDDLEKKLNALENLGKAKITGKDIPEVKFRFDTESGDKMFKALQQSFERRGIPWDSKAQAFAAALVITEKKETATATIKPPIEMRPVNVNKPDIQESVKLTNKEMDQLQFTADMMTGVFSEFGTELVDSMFEGKFAIDEVTEAVGKLILKMLMLEGIKALVSSIMNAFTPGSGSLFTSVFHKGGIAGNPQSFKTIAADTFIGAKKYHTGLMPNEMPAILTKDEMVLTQQQQGNLFALLNQSLSKTNSMGRQQIEIEIKGGLVAKNDGFYLDLDKNMGRAKRIVSAGSLR